MKTILLPIILSIASWLLPWYLLWCLHDSVENNDFYVGFIVPHEGDIITDDGNNLFKTGIVYSFLLFISLVSPWKLLDWIILILTVILCIPPVIGFLGELLNSRWRNGMIWQVHFSRFFCSFAPLVTSAIIYAYAID